MHKSIKQLNKELDREYTKARPTADLLLGLVLGIFGSLSVGLFRDLVIGNKKWVEWTYFIVFGVITFWAIRAIDQRGYRKVYNLEKELKKLKKKQKA